MSFFSTKILLCCYGISPGQTSKKLTAVQISMPQVTRSSTSIPNLKDCFFDIYLLVQVSGSQPQSSPHSALTLMQLHFCCLKTSVSIMFFLDLSWLTSWSSLLGIQQSPSHFDFFSVLMICFVLTFSSFSFASCSGAFYSSTVRFSCSPGSLIL